MLRQQTGPSELKGHQVMEYARKSHIDRSCLKAWATERAGGCYGQEVAENAFVDVIHALVAVEISVHGNAQVVAGNEVVDNA